MAKVRLKGIHISTSKRKGVKYEYHYAYKGGPRLYGKPGSPEYVEEYLQAHRRDFRETLEGLALRYQRSPEFARLSQSTRDIYGLYLKKEIVPELGGMPYREIIDPRSRRFYVRLRDKRSATAPKANMCLRICGAMLKWAVSLGHIEKHFCHGIPSLQETSRADMVFDDLAIQKLQAMRPHLSLPSLFALWTGQRQKDICDLTWGHIDGDYIRLTPSKTRKKGTRVSVFILPPVRALLSAIPRGESVTEMRVFLNSKGEPWKAGNFGNQWRAEAKRAGIDALHFHDLRGTFENRLWESGCSEAEAYTVTGRALAQQSANAYYRRSDELSRIAMMKLWGTFGEQNSPKESPKTIVSIGGSSAKSL